MGGKSRYVYCTLFYGNGRMQAFAKIDLDLGTPILIHLPLT